MKTIRTILPIALIVAAPMVMLYPIWTNPVSAGEDDVIYYYPLRKMVGDALRQGSVPLYTTREVTGAPVMADPQSAVLYPPTWVFAAIDAKLAYSLSVFLAFSLAGGGAYAYLRRLGLVRAAATFGSVAFMFCGFLVGHRVHLGMIHTACYLPWGLWCIEGLRRDRPRPGSSIVARLRPPPALLWMVPVAFLTITAGHWPTLIQMSVVWSAYLLLRGRPLGRALLAGVLAMLLATALAGPQVLMTAELLAQTTRQRIGYATAGENSFFPAAAVLALFPMIMGSRTPNFFSQQWWGPWHLCEMLGYVGLLTLVLGAAGVWRLYRKGEAPPAEGAAGDLEHPSAEDLRDLVRKWTWVGLGAFVWMLGYYLPTYRLVHMLPVLGVVRCPARLVLAVDMALATLGAISVHWVMVRTGAEGRIDLSANRLGRTVRRIATILLPLTMLTVLVLLGAAGWILKRRWADSIEFFNGGGRQMLASVNPASPAVWIPIALMILSGLGVRYWLRRPRSRTPALVAILLMDLFFITRFVDVPRGGSVAPDPERSPAAVWLMQNAPADRDYRIWGLSETYHHRPAELLLPKTANSLGFSTIAGYGPFQSPAHPHMLGFRIFGTVRDWGRLIRRNRLLSLYNVRYVLAADAEFRSVIESVRVPAGPPPPDGPNLLTDEWNLARAELDDEFLTLRTPFLWSWSIATQPVTLREGEVYRIALDARGPEGGAANFLRAEIFQQFEDGSYLQDDRWGLTVFSEQIGEDWRHFEWTFRAPDRLSANTTFRIFTMSERPIAVTGVSLRRSAWERPVGVGGRVAPGARVYRRLVELPPRRSEDDPVVIYENLLCPDVPARVADVSPPSVEVIERLKWSMDDSLGDSAVVPNLAVPPPSAPGARGWALIVVGGVGYLLVGLGAIPRNARRKKIA